MNNKLTIVLTTYNRPKFLKLAIDAILCQSFRRFKLVILDNGSGEETSQLILSYNDNRIEYVRNEDNNREFINVAFTYTDLKYIMITHDDDIMKNDLIERHINKMEMDNSIGLISSSINLIDVNGNKLNKVRPRLKKDKRWKKEEFIKEYFFKGDIIPCPSTIFRSSVIKKNKLKYNWDVGQAVDLFLLFQINLLDHHIYLYKTPLYNYRIHQNQDSERNRISMEYKVRPHIIKLLTNNNLHKYVNKYKQASLGIILQIILNSFFMKSINFKELKREINQLKNEGLTFNIISSYWFLFGCIRGLKNYLSK